jgi:YHS domain-containing protein
VAVTLHWKVARLGSVLAFLVATPTTSVTSLLVSYGLLGAKFVIFEFFAVITMGLVMGLVGNAAKSKAKVVVPPAQQALDPVCGMSGEVGKVAKAEYGGQTYYFCCPHCQQAFKDRPEAYMGGYSRNIVHRIKHVFRYAFVDMVKEI